MRIWHKILVAPAVAIVFLVALGAVSWQMLSRQNAALEDLARLRMAASQTAAEAAGDVSDVHSNVYRLFTWITNLKEDQIKKVSQEQHQRIDALIQMLATLAKQPGLSASEKQLLSDIQPMLEHRGLVPPTK